MVPVRLSTNDPAPLGGRGTWALLRACAFVLRRGTVLLHHVPARDGEWDRQKAEIATLWRRQNRR